MFNKKILVVILCLSSFIFCNCAAAFYYTCPTRIGKGCEKLTFENFYYVCTFNDQETNLSWKVLFNKDVDLNKDENRDLSKLKFIEVYYSSADGGDIGCDFADKNGPYVALNADKQFLCPVGTNWTKGVSKDVPKGITQAVCDDSLQDCVFDYLRKKCNY